MQYKNVDVLCASEIGIIYLHLQYNYVYGLIKIDDEITIS